MTTRIMSERVHKERVGSADRINAAVYAMREAKLWPIMLNAANRHGFQPRNLFELDHHTRAARGEAWQQMVTRGIGVRLIALWWGTTPQRVEACIGALQRSEGVSLLRPAEDDEVTPRLIAGLGDRRDDCASYRACLKAVSRGFGGQARCPRQCRGYKPTRLDVMDYVRAKPCGDKNAAPTKGGWNNG